MDDLTQTAALDGAPRLPDMIMRLARMGASSPTRLSFLHVLIRRLHAKKVIGTLRQWEMAPLGVTGAVCTLTLGVTALEFGALFGGALSARMADLVAAFTDQDGVRLSGSCRGVALARTEAEGGAFMNLFERILNA